MEKTIKLRTLNPYITCRICTGYLIDATTVTECLHTFCKSCLVKHLEENNNCPECDIVIHQSHPLQYISFDRTMQDIVYKLVPNLQQDELKRERDFYRLRGVSCPKNIPLNPLDNENNELVKERDVNFHKLDEQVSLCLDVVVGTTMKSLKRKYIRCSALATVTHLKKYIAKKALNSADKFREVDLLCNNELLGKDHTLKFVYVTRWRFKEPPLKLFYQPKLDV